VSEVQNVTSDEVGHFLHIEVMNCTKYIQVSTLPSLPHTFSTREQTALNRLLN